MNKITTLAALSLASALPLAHATEQKQAYIDTTFAAMDANKDGSIDKDEFSRFHHSRFDKHADTISAAFLEMDSDGDGLISKTEAAVVPEIAKYFDALDTDSDGSLSVNELQQAMVAAQTLDGASQ